MKRIKEDAFELKEVTLDTMKKYPSPTSIVHHPWNTLTSRKGKDVFSTLSLSDKRMEEKKGIFSTSSHHHSLPPFLQFKKVQIIHAHDYLRWSKRRKEWIKRMERGSWRQCFFVCYRIWKSHPKFVSLLMSPNNQDTTKWERMNDVCLSLSPFLSQKTYSLEETDIFVRHKN